MRCVARKRRSPQRLGEECIKAYAPTGRLLIPEEVAAHVVFWLSDMSKPVSGAVYEVEQYSVIGRNRNTNEK